MKITNNVLDGRFFLGKVKQIVPVGEYHIIEFIDNDGDLRYMPFVGGEETDAFFKSLDEALLYAIAWHHMGHGNAISYFVNFAMKLLGE